ncbi:MAG TPA: PilZ domain-containing protein [Nitrospira sp.]|nr:PilZ domain-containing protein [Nitrospira sp.]
MIVRTERYRVDCPIRFTHEGGVTGEGELINLSMNGCAFRSHVSMEEGMLLAIYMQPGSSTAPIKIDMARVRWVNNEECGIEFMFVYEKERKALLRWIRALAVQFIH